MAQQVVADGDVETKTVSAFKALKPQLTVEATMAADALEFYKIAFGAAETGRFLHPKRKADKEVPHIFSAQLELAGSVIVVSESSDSASSAKTTASSVTLVLETEDVEAAISKAVAAGAVQDGEVVEVEGAGAGAQGKVNDPYGITWIISSPAKKTPEVAE